MAVPREFEIRAVRPADRDIWLGMRRALWPDSTAEEVDTFLETRKWDALERPEVLIAVTPSGAGLGFAELSVRACAEGCRTSPVGYLEGLYVRPERRRMGLARALAAAAAEWARGQGLTEMASDASVDNSVSIEMHKALGFEEAGRLVCFVRRLPRRHIA